MIDDGMYKGHIRECSISKSCILCANETKIVAAPSAYAPLNILLIGKAMYGVEVQPIGIHLRAVYKAIAASRQGFYIKVG
jgi:hypothetical protein